MILKALNDPNLNIVEYDNPDDPEWRKGQGSGLTAQVGPLAAVPMDLDLSCPLIWGMRTHV